MSKFGKKAIKYWDYLNTSKEHFIRFLNSDKNIQSEILEKWFPIGMRVHIRTINIKGNIEYIQDDFIIGYEEFLTFYKIKTNLGSHSIRNIIPYNYILKKERIDKINKIL